MKSKTIPSIITMAILLFAVVATIGSATAVPSAIRTLPASVAPGEEFQITISYSAIGSMGQVNETLPDGFTYVSSSLSSGVVTDTNWVKFTLMGGSSFTYNVTASDVADTYTFSGTVKDEDKITAVIGGDTSIGITSTSDVSATRTLPASVAPGEEFQITISYSAIGSMGQVNETLPDGFTYVSSSLSSGVITDTNWVKFTLMGGSSFTYNVTASDVAGTYTFSGTVKDEDKNAAVIGGNTDVAVGAAPANIVINEFVANPSSGSEWVELYNKETIAVDIGGWQVDDIEGGSSPTTIPADTTIAAGGFYVVNLSSVLNNGGDTVRLLDDAGALVDSYAYTSSTAGVSEGRTPDGADTWTTFDTPTPGASNGVGVNQPPTAVIASPTASGTYHVDEEVSFLSTGSSDPDGTIEAYTWDFGDGNTSTVANTTHTYTTTGSMTVTLTVTDNDGATDTTTVTIDVLEPEVSVNLYEGWNLMAVPVHDTSADTAAGLASKITGCKEVVMWDAAEDEYVTYTKIGDDWAGTDFAITGGMGIFVNVEGATTVGFTGDAWS